MTVAEFQGTQKAAPTPADITDYCVRCDPTLLIRSPFVQDHLHILLRYRDCSLVHDS